MQNKFTGRYIHWEYPTSRNSPSWEGNSKRTRISALQIMKSLVIWLSNLLFLPPSTQLPVLKHPQSRFLPRFSDPYKIQEKLHFAHLNLYVPLGTEKPLAGILNRLQSIGNQIQDGPHSFRTWTVMSACRIQGTTHVDVVLDPQRQGLCDPIAIVLPQGWQINAATIAVQNLKHIFQAQTG
jgi:hypothetical protein